MALSGAPMDKKTQDTLFSSKSLEWATPQHFFDQLEEQFGEFTLDPCANESNYKVKNRFTEKDNGLEKDEEQESGISSVHNLKQTSKRKKTIARNARAEVQN